MGQLVKNHHTSPSDAMKLTVPTSLRIGIAGAERPLCASISRLLGSQGVHHTVLVEDDGSIPRGLPRASTAPMRLDEHLPAFSPLANLDVLVLAPAAPAPDGFTRQLEIVDAAAAAGVRHFVYVSILNATDDALYTGARDHFRVEQRIRQTGAQFTILRPTLLLERAANLLAPTGHMYGPGGNGTATLLPRQQLAQKTVRVLADLDAYAGQTHPITGPEAFTPKQIAAQLSGQEGRPIHYHPEDAETAFIRLVDYAVPPWKAAAVVTLYEALTAQQFAPISSVRALP